MGSTISVYNKISQGLDLKIEPFDVSKRYTKPHRHNKYLEVVYFSKGSGYHYMDQQSYPIIPPLVFIVKKDQVHHWQIDSVPIGYVILVKQAFLEKTLDKHINTQFGQLEQLPAFNLSADPALEALFHIASQLIKEHIKDHEIAIEGVLKAILAKILHHAPSTTHLEKSLAFTFSQLLQEFPKNDVGHYARLLHTTPQNLNANCRKELGKTASQVIAEHLIKEAKRQLLYTDLSVNEMAYSAGFKDASHFVKYFKRFEGITPLQFKKREL